MICTLDGSDSKISRMAEGSNGSKTYSGVSLLMHPIGDYLIMISGLARCSLRIILMIHRRADMIHFCLIDLFAV